MVDRSAFGDGFDLLSGASAVHDVADTVDGCGLCIRDSIVEKVVTGLYKHVYYLIGLLSN